MKIIFIVILLAIKNVGSTSDDTLLITVEYIDYGNHESLPVHRIRALDNKFSVFPRQAMLCTLAGIEWTSLCCSAENLSPVVEWSPEVLQWLYALIAEKPIDLIVYHWMERNRVEVDVCVPLEAILSAESLATLPTCIPVDDIVTYTREQNCSDFSLLSIMQSFGLTVTPVSGDRNPDESSKIPTEDKDLQKQLCASPGLILNPATSEFCTDGIAGEEGECLFPNDNGLVYSTLPPLILRVETSGMIIVVVSHVIDPWNFYVQPVQESGASGDHISVCDHISKSCVQSVHFSEHCIGDLCCVQSAQDGEWYRGVVTEVTKGQHVTRCQVHHFDHGNSQWYMATQVKVLPGELCRYPAQAVHCMLSDVHPFADDEVWKKDTLDKFKLLTQSAHLMAFIKSEG